MLNNILVLRALTRYNKSVVVLSDCGGIFYEISKNQRSFKPIGR